MEVRRIDPEDEAGLAESADVLRASDKDMWPELAGFTLRDIRAFAQFRGTTRRYELLAAAEPGGPILGVGLVERTLRDNLHAVEVTVAVHPSHRRRGAGTALVDAMGERAIGQTGGGSSTPSSTYRCRSRRTIRREPLRRRLGSSPPWGATPGISTVPVDPARLESLGEVVAGARDAADYRTLTFDAPWPAEFVEDQCELLRRMSTDEPAGDSAREEEIWDAERLREHEDLRVARGTSKLVAVAQHVPSGRLVAMSELLLAPDAPDQAWQLITVVHPAHRGHRLGLAVKIANLEALASAPRPSASSSPATRR